MVALLSTKCPYCSSADTLFNLMMSWENGAGEIRNCRQCGRSWDVDYHEELRQIRKEIPATMEHIDRTRLRKFLDSAGDALRQLLDEASAQEDHHREYSDLAQEADELLEMVELGAEVKGDLTN